MPFIETEICTVSCTWITGDSGGPLSCQPQSRPFFDGQTMSVYGIISQCSNTASNPCPSGYKTRIVPHIGRITSSRWPFSIGRQRWCTKFRCINAIKRRVCSVLSAHWVVAASGCFPVGGTVNLRIASWKRQQRNNQARFS